jgi:O-antigen ligase
LPTQLGKHFWPNWSFVYGLRLDYLSPTLYFTDVFILLIFIFWLPEFFHQVRNLQKKYLIGFALLLISLALGLAGAKNYWAGFYGMAKFLEFSFLIFYVRNNYGNFNKTVLFFCIFLSVAFETLLAFLQNLNQGSIGGIFYLFGERTFNAGTPGIANASINGQLFLRSYATFPHPNVLAGFMVLAMILLLIFSSKNYLLRAAAFIGIIFGTATLLTTLSRTAIVLWLIYLIVLFGLWIFEKYKKRKFNSHRLVFPGLIIGAAILFILLQNNFIVERFLTTKLSDESFVQRQELIGQSMNMFFQSPLLGVGVNNYFNNLNVFSLNGNTFLIQPVHNIFLLTMSETGLVGVCFMLIVFFKSLFGAFKNKQNRKYLLMLIFAVMFLGTFDHYFLTLQQGQLLFAIVLGMSLANP